MKRITIEIERDSDLIPVMDFLGQSLHSATAHRYNVKMGKRVAAWVRIEHDELRFDGCDSWFLAQCGIAEEEGR